MSRAPGSQGAKGGGSRAASSIARGGYGTRSLKQVAETILAKDVAIMADIAAGSSLSTPPELTRLAGAGLRMYATGPVPLPPTTSLSP